MQRTLVGTFALAGLFALAVLNNRAAAQRFDPMPLDDADAVELELPQPQNEYQERPRDLSRPYLGVTFDPNVGSAAIARAVSAGSPADQAGLRAGDTLVALNGREIGSYEEALRIIGQLKPGEVLDIEISRRVSLHSRAVLDGQPLDAPRTSVYRMESESLPAPLLPTYQERPRAAAPRYAPNPQRPPQNNNPAASRRNQTNRNNDANDRNDRNRGLFQRRR